MQGAARTAEAPRADGGNAGTRSGSEPEIEAYFRPANLKFGSNGVWIVPGEDKQPVRGR